MRLELLFLVAGSFSSPPMGLALPSWKRPPRRSLDGRPGSPRPSLAGAVAAPQLSPSPLGLLTTEDEGPPKISCFAPRSYAGSTFELFAVGAGVPAQSVSAKPDQHKVDFTLGGATPASRCYRCRYRSYNGSAWQTSAFSMEIVVNGAGGGTPAGGSGWGSPLPAGAWLLRPGCAGNAADPNPPCFSPASSDAGCHPPTAAPTGRPLPTSTTLRQGTGTGDPPGSAAAPVARPSDPLRPRQGFPCG